MAQHCKESDYHALFVNLPHGFALCRMISEPDQRPDFIYLETNKAFETITGLTQVNGKKASQIESLQSSEWLRLYNRYARVMKTGTTERFETCLDDLDKWLDLTVYKSGSDCFVIILDDITERKTREIESRQNNTLLEKIISQVPVLLYRFERSPDGSYRVPYSNSRVYDLFGCHPWEIRDEFGPIINAMHPEDRDKMVQSIEDSACTLQPWQLEYRVQLPGEPVKWILGRSAPEKMSDGRIVWSGYNMDITERKTAEQALKESRDFFEKIISKVPGMVYEFIRRPDGTFCVPYCNESIRDIYGCSPADVRETFAPIYDMVYPEDREQLSVSIEESARELSAWKCEHRVQVPGGPITWVLGKSTPEKLEDGSILWTGYEVDITERKAIEKALEERDALFAKLSSMVPGMLYLFARKPDGTYCVPYSSPGIRAVFGCGPEDVLNTSDPIFKVIHPEDRPRVIASIEESTRDLSLWMSEFRVRIPGKDIKWMLATSVPEKLSDGTIIWSGYNTDITERKHVELEKEQLQAQLIQAQKMESVGRLAGGIAHDFNNMLSVIVGNTEIVMDDVEPSNPLHDSLKEILNAARRSADLTRQLLTFARKQIAAPKVLSLNDTIAGMLTMLKRLIGEDIELGWYPGHELWDVRIDPSQVDQLLANLMVNARDAIAGVGKIIIETSNTASDKAGCGHKPECIIPGEYVLLTISDSGCGMDKDTLANIFEPFFTTKKEGQGTGLGLATVYGIVKQNNGFVYVYSEPEHGSTFRIYLPRHFGENPQSADEKKETAIRGGTETILVVEDEKAVLTSIKSKLERLGYHVLPAGKTTRAMELALQHKGSIDLLLTDVVMPEMNGKELSEKISATNPGLKCLYMSGYTTEVISRQGILHEGVHFIAKPFLSKDLAEKIRETLDSK